MGDDRSRRPADTPFKQQKLPAWQPILSAGTVLPTFFVIGVLFIPVGIAIVYFSDTVQEIVHDYTDCTTAGGTAKCKDLINETTSETSCQCDPIKFTLSKEIQGQVFLFYSLSNFYQNHRRYLRSRDDNQLQGRVGTLKHPVKPSRDCMPFALERTRIIYPCGAVANSFFSDEISLKRCKSAQDSGCGEEIHLDKKGIAWKTDKDYRFKKPSFWDDAQGKPDHPAWSIFAKPKAWSSKRELWNWTDGVTDEDFIVWMRVAALPNFRKLYRFINYKVNPDSKLGLPAGNYSFSISYSFPVTKFGGRKSVILSTTSILGGKNPFLGYCYVTVGSICLVLGIVFMFIHVKFGKRFVVPNESPLTLQDNPLNQPQASTSKRVGANNVISDHSRAPNQD